MSEFKKETPKVPVKDLETHKDPKGGKGKPTSNDGGTTRPGTI